MSRSRIPPAAAGLGAAGLLPFVAGAAGVWLLDEPRYGAALSLLTAYGAVVLSFMGAVHWGMAMRGDSPAPGRAMAASVVPALVGWFALAIPAGAGLVLLAAGFAGVYVLDARAAAAGIAPRWYRRLRIPLTVVVLLCLGIALAGLRRGAAA